MVAINTSPSQNGQIPEWRRKGNYTFPIVLSPNQEFASATYDVVGAPTTLLLDQEGKVLFRHPGSGPRDEQVIESEIRELLGLDPFEGLEPAKPEQPAKK
jgi:hypothetical protein